MGVQALICWSAERAPSLKQADYDKAESVRADPITPYHDRALSWIAKGERRRAEADCKHIAGVDADKGRDCSRRIAEAFGEPRDGGGEKTATAQNAVGIEWQEKGDHRSGSRISRSLRLSHANFRTTTMRCCARSLPPPRPEAKQKCAIPGGRRSAAQICTAPAFSSGQRGLASAFGARLATASAGQARDGGPGPRQGARRSAHRARRFHETVQVRYRSNCTKRS